MSIVRTVYALKTPVVGVWSGSDRPGKVWPGNPKKETPHEKAVVAIHCRTRTSSMLLPIPLANIVLSFLSSLFPDRVDKHPHLRPGPPPSPNNVLNFHLRHFHVATSSAQLYFADAPHDYISSASSLTPAPLSIVTSPLRTTRPSSLDNFQAARRLSMRGQSALLDWQEDEVPGPDVTRRETLLLLAKMTSNTYFEPHTRGWYNLTDEWNVVGYLSIPLSASPRGRE